MAGSNNMGAATVVAAALVALVGGTAFLFGPGNSAPTTPAQPRPTTGEVRETQRQAPPSEKLTPPTAPSTAPGDKTTKPKPPPPDPG